MNPVNAPEHVRDIDRGALPTRFARGWHCLGLAESFRDGKPHASSRRRPEAKSSTAEAATRCSAPATWPGRRRSWTR